MGYLTPETLGTGYQSIPSFFGPLTVLYTDGEWLMSVRTALCDVHDRPERLTQWCWFVYEIYFLAWYLSPLTSVDNSKFSQRCFEKCWYAWTLDSRESHHRIRINTGDKAHCRRCFRRGRGEWPSTAFRQCSRRVDKSGSGVLLLCFKFSLQYKTFLTVW